MNAKRAGDAGLSLIEVLVSLAIFAVIGVAGLTVLDTVARTGEIPKDDLNDWPTLIGPSW